MGLTGQGLPLPVGTRPTLALLLEPPQLIVG